MLRNFAPAAEGSPTYLRRKGIPKGPILGTTIQPLSLLPHSSMRPWLIQVRFPRINQQHNSHTQMRANNKTTNITAQ